MTRCTTGCATHTNQCLCTARHLTPNVTLSCMRILPGIWILRPERMCFARRHTTHHALRPFWCSLADLLKANLAKTSCVTSVLDIKTVGCPQPDLSAACRRSTAINISCSWNWMGPTGSTDAPTGQCKHLSCPQWRWFPLPYYMLKLFTINSGQGPGHVTN